MAISLTKPLDDTVISTQEKNFLLDLQANILKGHGREHVALVFLAITDANMARKFLHGFPVTSAFRQRDIGSIQSARLLLAGILADKFVERRFAARKRRAPMRERQWLNRKVRFSHAPIASSA